MTNFYSPPNVEKKIIYHQVYRLTSKELSTLNQRIQIRVPENAAVLKLNRKNFTVHCGYIRLESGLIDVSVVFGYQMIIKKKKEYRTL